MEIERRISGRAYVITWSCGNSAFSHLRGAGGGLGAQLVLECSARGSDIGETDDSARLRSREHDWAAIEGS